MGRSGRGLRVPWVRRLSGRQDAPAASLEDEEPSLASATGISSRDSAESEWYSAGGAAAWMGPGAGACPGSALRGNAGKGSH